MYECTCCMWPRDLATVLYNHYQRYNTKTLTSDFSPELYPLNTSLQDYEQV